jgi:hypothetical protein
MHTAEYSTSNSLVALPPAVINDDRCTLLSIPSHINSYASKIAISISFIGKASPSLLLETDPNILPFHVIQLSNADEALDLSFKRQKLSSGILCLYSSSLKVDEYEGFILAMTYIEAMRHMSRFNVLFEGKAIVKSRVVGSEYKIVLLQAALMMQKELELLASLYRYTALKRLEKSRRSRITSQVNIYRGGSLHKEEEGKGEDEAHVLLGPRIGSLVPTSIAIQLLQQQILTDRHVHLSLSNIT